MNEKTIYEMLALSGAVGKLVPIKCLADLEKNISQLEENHLLADEFNLKEFAQFNFEPAKDFSTARSILIIAYPHFPTRFHFQYEGKEKAFVIPPTYLNALQADDSHMHKLSEYCMEEGYRLERAILPKKLLAVCSGLGEYGRNNIVYINGMGSFARLAAYFIDLPCGEDEWREPAAMPCCADCQACRKACPTGAIGEDRFLLHAERCLTWWNEKPSGIAFPDWILPEWHNCLVGCMLCQLICPENKSYINNIIEGPIFSEEETELMVKGIPAVKLPEPLQKKLSQSGLIEHYVPRNFRAVLER